MKFPKLPPLPKFQLPKLPKMSSTSLLIMAVLMMPIVGMGYSALSPYGIFGGVSTFGNLPGNLQLNLSSNVSSSSATLSAPFSGSAASYQIIFADGESRSASLSSGATSFSWTTALNSLTQAYATINGFQTGPAQMTLGFTSDQGMVGTPGSNLWYKWPAVDLDTTFTVASGCATVSGAKGGATSGQFATTATTCTPVINLPNAPNGWICFAQDITHNVVFTQTASTTTSCTVTGTTTSGDTVQFKAFGY